MAKPTATSVKSQLDTHEAVCAERYEQILFRINRLERVLLGSAGAIIIILLSIIVTLTT